MIRGTLVTLTALDPKNAETVRGWANDPEVNRWTAIGHVPITPGEEVAFFENAGADARAGIAYHFEIHAADDGRIVGICGFIGVDRIDRHGEVGIFLDSHEHRKGFGRDALITLLRFGFETLGLNTVRLRCVDGNDGALELYRSIGFRDVGTYREGRYSHGRFRDVHLLDMTRADWDSMDV